nr:hypothetical protein [uncultured Rhodoferax sp.]
MTRFESFETEKRRHIVSEHCDPAIAQAVVRCIDSFKPNDSLSIGVRSRSIPTKIAKHLDPALADFARRNGVPMTGWNGLAELVLDHESMDFRIHMWGRKVIARAELNGNMHWSQATHTVDTLRYFAQFCCSFRSTRIPIQVAEKGKDGKFTYHDSEQRPRMRKDAYPKPMEVWFDQEGWCELCCRPTETEQFKRERIDAGDDIKPDVPLYVRSLSTRFCADHASIAGRSYKRDVVRRKYWHALMRALIEARLSQGLYPLDFEERRAVTYGLVFPQKSILPSVKAVHDYVANPPIRLGEAASRAHLLGLLKQAMAEAKDTSFDISASSPTPHMDIRNG